MTRDQAKGIAPLLTAWAEGKTIQFRSSEGERWVDCDEPMLFHHHNNGAEHYRIKPEPITRNWNKPSDVPGPVCWIRKNNEGIEVIIHCVFINGIGYTDAGNTYRKYWDSLSDWTYSTDRKTWSPCTVTEEAP
jgi:hypothetical protein